MTMTVRPVTAAVGAEISGVDLARLDDATFAAIERAWTEHAMLLFRGQAQLRGRAARRACDSRLGARRSAAWRGPTWW